MLPFVVNYLTDYASVFCILNVLSSDLKIQLNKMQCDETILSVNQTENNMRKDKEKKTIRNKSMVKMTLFLNEKDKYVSAG